MYYIKYLKRIYCKGEPT